MAKKIFKIFGSFLIIFLFAANPTGTKALSVCFPLIGCSNPDSSSFYKEIEDRYGFDQDVWRSAKRKTNAPRVEIFFDNSNPKPGEKVTAHALPEFFKNDPQNLYYTWYLIHTENGIPQTATNSIDSGKIEAARVISHGDYDPELDGQNYTEEGKDPDKDGWPSTDNDNEKNYTPFGGADGTGGLKEEEVLPACSGKGDRSTNLCEYETADPTSSNYYSLKSTQGNYWCQACYDQFSKEGGLPGDSDIDNLRRCCYTFSPPTYTDPGTGDITSYPYDPGVDYCSGKSYAAPYKTCFDNFGTANVATVSQCVDDQYEDCTQKETSNNDEIYSGVSRCYKHKFSSGESTAFQEDDSSGIDFPVSCSHKWKSAPGYKSGSGHFETGEEKYWKTDPADPDTDGDGFPDEADAVGLGQENFTWTYQPGDRVGVVIEGTSMIPTDETNAYYKILWGYPDVCDGSKKDLLDDDQCDDSDDYGFGFLATKAPGEEEGEKLKISLSFSPDNPSADPSAENAENILEDGTITDADQISVASSLDSTDLNPSSLFYTWQISKTADLSKDAWVEVTNIKDNFSAETSASGIGIPSFNFSPKKKILLEDGADIIYFKVTLTATTASDLTKDRGRASVVVPINKKGIKLGLYKVEVKDGKATLDEEVCKEGLYKTLCPVVNGQMLAAKVTSKKYDLGNSEFSWSLDGEPYAIPPDSAKSFSGQDARTIFFPITKEDEEIHELAVTASPKDALAPVTGGRLVTVVKPTLFIKSSDPNISWPQVLAAENEEEMGVIEKEESLDSFEALTDSRPSYYLDFVPYYLLGEDANTQISWLVNGTNVLDPFFYKNNPALDYLEFDNKGRVIKFPTGQTAGELNTLSAEVKKYWSGEEKNIMSSVWDIEPQSITGETSATISAVLNKSSEEISQNQPTQILATVGTHLPHYLMYNLRLALTILVMFFVSAGFYSLSQGLKLFDE